MGNRPEQGKGGEKVEEDNANGEGEKSVTWHEQYKDKMTFGQKMADGLARGMGSWTFIIVQTMIVICWMTFNVVALALR